MAFKLGNYAVKEILQGVAENLDHTDILYILDQLSSSEIAVDAQSTDIVDKNGAVIRTIYKAKTGTYTATSALVSPVLLNANSGNEMKVASDTETFDAPKMVTVAAGATVDVSDIVDDAVILVKGFYPNGANGDSLTQSTTASLADKTFKYDSAAKKITLPGLSETSGETTIEGAPQYLVKYQRKVKSGLMLANRSDEFAKTVSLTLYAAIMDPCSDTYKAAYVYVPSFTPAPSVTINFSSDTQEMDYTGNINISYCDACAGKVLYYIYFPEEDVITTVECAE